MMKKEKGKTKSEKVRMSLLFTFSLLIFTSLVARAATGVARAGEPGGTLGVESSEPDAEVSIGKVSVGTDCTSATIPVTVRVINYGETARKARLVMTLTPVGGGMDIRWESDELSGFGEHNINAYFTKLVSGTEYCVKARVVMVGTNENAGVCEGSFVAESPFAVRNVTSRQRYPWNGFVDIACDLTGVGLVKLSATVLTNGAELCEAQTFIGETTFDLDAAGGVTNGVRLLWNAAADLPAGFRTQDVQVKVMAEKYTPPSAKARIAALSSVAGAQTVTVSEAYFYPAKADIAPKDANRSHYRAYIIESADDGDAVLAHAKEKGMSGIDSEKKVMLVSDKLAWQDVISEYQASSIANPGIFSPAAFDLTDNAYLVVFYHTDGVASEVCVLGADSYDLEIKGELVFDADDFDPDEYNSGWQAMPPPPPPADPLSNVFALDLVVGDRVAQEPAETIVVNPAWGNAKTATVSIDGESSPRTYTSASNDLWETAALEPGRYAMTLEAGEDNGSAAFWKTGEGWVVFDSLSITADVTFEAGKTYLFFGTNTVSGKTLTVEDGAKFAYDESAPAGFLGGTVAELPKRYMKVVEGNLYRIVEMLKGSEDNPWIVGAGVEAWTNGTDKLVINGAGEVALMPWTEFADGITKLVKDEGVTGLEGVVATLPNLTTVNGLTLGDFSVAALGVVKAAGVSAIEVKNGEAKLDVVVSRSDELGESADWKPVSTNEVTVPAPGEQGFFIVAPQGK